MDEAGHIFIHTCRTMIYVKLVWPGLPASILTLFLLSSYWVCFSPRVNPVKKHFLSRKQNWSFSCHHLWLYWILATLFVYADEPGAEAPATVAAAAPYPLYLISRYAMFLSRYSALFSITLLISVEPNHMQVQVLPLVDAIVRTETMKVWGELLRFFLETYACTFCFNVAVADSFCEELLILLVEDNHANIGLDDCKVVLPSVVDLLYTSFCLIMLNVFYMQLLWLTWNYLCFLT